jgi:hypothetical protein
MAKWQNGKMAK